MEEWELEALKQVAELQGDLGTAELGMHSVCAVRSAAARRDFGRGVCGEGSGVVLDLEVGVKAFPMRFLTRNLCIVGKVSERV